MSVMLDDNFVCISALIDNSGSMANLDTNTMDIIESYKILQKRFNPAFDEFNLTQLFLNDNYYADIFWH